MKLDRPIHTVTFDCWETLIFQPNPQAASIRRAETFSQILCERGHEVSAERAAVALDAGWQCHYQTWRRGTSSGAPEIVAFALEHLDIRDAGLTANAVTAVQETALGDEVLVLDGARETLEKLAERGIHRALICDTGFTPGRVVSQLLDRLDLRNLLQATVFSDEVGVPKPDARMFRAALTALGSEAAGAVHVGDLRSTDIAGARAMGMGSIRLRWRHDDTENLPDGDEVAESHAHLLEILSG